VPWFADAEAEHSIFFSICAGLIAHPERFPSPPYLVTVERETVVAAALETPGRKWVVSRSERPAVEALVEHLWARQWPVPGVLGPARAASTFKELWMQRAACHVRAGKAQRIYELRQLKATPPCAGRARAGRPEDRDVVTPWARAFTTEIHSDETPDQNAELIERMIADGRLHVWEDGAVVSMAGETARTPHGTGINAVYTPPPLRRRGYATSLVAAVSDRILGSGQSFCFLFTDLANSTSNDIYQRIGYRPVADWADYFFD
jgi:predicted GNAT family acetyltransferase